uniref:Uncharacterized protein n=1 Tax=Aegilops tauschii subsp. strangulata TaxID=200361 RepID=A0A453M624_AEGTS
MFRGPANTGRCRRQERERAPAAPYRSYPRGCWPVRFGCCLLDTKNPAHLRNICLMWPFLFF